MKLKMKIMTEISRGPQKKLTKGRASEMAKDCLIDALAAAYYRFENNDDFQNLSEGEQDLVLHQMNILGSKMAKSIGREYYTV